MKVFLGSTFSPMMLSHYGAAEIVEIGLDDIPPGLPSVVGHEITAQVLSVLLEEPVEFNRQNVTLERGDVLFCIVPGFRTNESREFTRAEIVSTGFRCFQVRAK